MRYSSKLLGLSFMIFSLALILSACNGGDCKAGSSSRTQGCDEFKRHRATVRKGAASASTLPVFSQSGWHPFKAGEAITTDGSGLAEMNFSGCWPGQIFCFKDSALQFKVEKCNQVTFSGTPLGCVPVGSVYTNGPCPGEYTINTGSARIIKQGTVLSITYLPDRRDVTLVIVLEGSAVVEPVANIEPLELANDDRVDSGMFYFTMPDDQLSPVGGLQPRQAYPIPELPPVVDQLDIWDWMFEVRDRAEIDGIPLDNWPPELGGPGEIVNPPPQPGREVFVNSGGGALADPRGQEALLRAVNWPEIAAVAGQEDAQLTGFVDGRPIDLLRDAPHDPELARALLAEAGYPDGVGMTIFYPPDEADLARVAKMMVQFLGEVGFDAGITQITADMDEQLQRMEEAGEAFVILNR